MKTIMLKSSRYTTMHLIISFLALQMKKKDNDDDDEEN